MSAPVLVYEDEFVQLWHGDYRAALEMLEGSDAACIVTDPPYGETSLEAAANRLAQQTFDLEPTA